MKPLSTEKKLILMLSFFIIIFAYGIYNLFQPDLFPMQFIRGKAVQVREDLIIGPYPSSKELLKLKRMGVTIIVNLMSMESPIEKPLIQEEKRLCKKYEITCVDFPMSFLRLNSDFNQQQIQKAVRYIESTPGKKYAHCYLGRHRVRRIRDHLEAKERGKVSQISD